MSIQVIVSHNAADYDQWYAAFTDHEKVRRSHGATGHRVYRSVDDPGGIVIVTEFPDAGGARAFLADPSLKEAMARAGVTSAPEIRVCETAEIVAY
jgi:quinol monooxygenase YgiN